MVLARRDQEEQRWFIYHFQEEMCSEGTLIMSGRLLTKCVIKQTKSAQHAWKRMPL